MNTEAKWGFHLEGALALVGLLMVVSIVAFLDTYAGDPSVWFDSLKAWASTQTGRFNEWMTTTEATNVLLLLLVGTLVIRQCH